MPYASHRDREPHDLELRNPAFPVAPLNLFLTSTYATGVYDLCWDDPAALSANSRFTILGVNVYRSFDWKCAGALVDAALALPPTGGPV